MTINAADVDLTFAAFLVKANCRLSSAALKGSFKVRRFLVFHQIQAVAHALGFRIV